MKKIPRKIFITSLIAVLVACAQLAFAYNVQYTYDEAGNRIKREIVLSTTKASTMGLAGSEIIKETLSERMILIYPNPTKGILKIAISNYNPDDNGSLSVYNLSGQELISIEINDSETTVDLSSYQNGVYLLRINLSGVDSTWKIIKE